VAANAAARLFGLPAQVLGNSAPTEDGAGLARGQLGLRRHCPVRKEPCYASCFARAERAQYAWLTELFSRPEADRALPYKARRRQQTPSPSHTPIRISGARSGYCVSTLPGRTVVPVVRLWTCRGRRSCPAAPSASRPCAAARVVADCRSASVARDMVSKRSGSNPIAGARGT